MEVVNLKRRGGILSMTTDDGSRQLEIERSAHHETRRELEASHHLLRDMETRLQHAQMTILELREQLAEATKPKVLPAVVAKASHPPQPSPHSEAAIAVGKSPVLDKASANFSMSGVSRCSGMFGINS